MGSDSASRPESLKASSTLWVSSTCGGHNQIHGGQTKVTREARTAEKGFRVPAIVVRVGGGVLLASLRILWSKCGFGAYGGRYKNHDKERKGDDIPSEDGDVLSGGSSLSMAANMVG